MTGDKDSRENPRSPTPKAAPNPDPAQLRGRAEQKADELEDRGLESLSPGEIRRVLHELRVHQIELEMQNEELRATREQLETSKARYFDLYDLAPVGYLTLSEKGLILEANLTAATLVGVTRSELPGQPLSRFILRDGGDIYYLLLNKLLKTGRPQTCELRLLRKDGRPFWVRLEAVVAPDKGEARDCRVVMSDITELKRTEEDLRESERRLIYAERLAHVGHWHWDVKADELSWSEEVFRIFGQRSDRTPSFDGFLRSVVQQDRERVQDAIKECLAGKREASVEFQIVRPDGDVRTVTCISERLLNADGSPTRIFGAFQDVTDARRVQKESFARQKLESVGTLASGIAHDFNNLLGATLAQADLALDEYLAGSSPEGELKSIRNTAILGAEIVRQLMTYAGKESEVVGLVDVSQVAMEMVELLKVSVSKHTALKADLRRNLPAIRGSAGQIRQIVMNLVMNASEALGDRDGVIHLTTSRVAVDRAAAISKGVAEGDYLSLEVIDTGRGIPLETQPRVFEPFFTTKSPGHGLGLAVVQGITRDLGGAIHLASEPGKGTTIEVLLPCARTASIEPKEATADSKSNPLQGATVLVVEDEDLLRQAVVMMLRKNGLGVVETSDGTAALETIRTDTRSIDILFLDLTLPGCGPQKDRAMGNRAQ
jgi:PAS domain S-box-containing protein